VKAAFKEDSLECDVQDVFIVPDYTALFANCCDPTFSNVFTEEETMHQFRFEAVTVSDSFPLGCKTTWRAFDAEKLIEIKRMNKLACLSESGQLIGLEAFLTHCPWWPLRNADNVEGTYLLQRLPHRDNNLIEPASFYPQCHEHIQETLTEIYRTYTGEVVTLCNIFKSS
jgi:hypothetical protein